MIMRLLSNCEIVGVLSKVIADKQQVKLVFNLIKEIELPVDVVLVEKLQGLLGQCIGILNIDGEFFVRIVKG
jgi:hypothetical protein